MEGPSIHLLAEELQPFVNQKIKKIYGNAHFDKEALTHQTIKEIFAFAKRLIIQLDTHAIVTHFLMYGTYRIDTPRENMPPRFAIETNKNKLFFYNCSTKCIENSHLKTTYPFEFDILSPQWDIKKVIKAVKKHPRATIDDVLLDQEIFAGVGNIIKNEALFMSKVSPLRRIETLSDKKLKEIALNAREFSQNFFNWRKEFELKKHLQIYRKKLCPLCGSKVVRGKTGARQRWSFYCPKTQK